MQVRELSERRENHDVRRLVPCHRPQRCHLKKIAKEIKKENNNVKHRLVPCHRPQKRHLSAYVSIHRHTSAYVRLVPFTDRKGGRLTKKNSKKNSRSFQGVIPLAIVARCACAYFLVCQFIVYKFVDSYFLVCDFISR
jgi:hypothetical protein